MEDTQLSAYVWKSSCIPYVCIMRSMHNEELSQPECCYISTFSTLLSQCVRLEAGGQRTEQWVAGEQQLGCTEAGPPSPSQGLFSALCRYQVDIQYLQIMNIYSWCTHSFILPETDFLQSCCVRKVNIWTGPSPRTNSSPLSTIVGVAAHCWDNTRYQEQQ